MECAIWTSRTIVVLLLFWKLRLVDGQADCLVNFPDPLTIVETDSPGEVLFNVTGGSAARWSYQIIRPGAPASNSLRSYFRLQQTNGRVVLYLDKTLDLEEVNQYLENEFTIQFSVICESTGARDVPNQWFLTVTAVNEFTPEFVSLPEGGFNISEAKRINDTILVLENYVVDRDVVPNHLGFDFTLLPTSDPKVDGRQKVMLKDSLTGTLGVKETLDYEAMEPDAAYYLLRVSVGDRNGLTSTSTVRINLIDADDLPPEFWYPTCPSPCFTSYTAAIQDSFEGQITWLEPAAIAARDLDTIGSRVTYNFKKGEPKDYDEYLSIDRMTGVPSVIKPVSDSDAPSFFVIVEAVESTPLKHSQQTTLWLKVTGRNGTEPTLPPVVVERSGSAEVAFRIAAIVLGILLGIILVLLVIFVVCSMGSKVRSSPVLPKAIGKLSIDDTTPEDLEAQDETMRGKGKGKKSVNLNKSSGGFNFMRSSHPPSPSLQAYTIRDREPAAQNLPISGEIEYEQHGIVTEDRQQAHHSGISTISGAGIMHYDDHADLVGSDDGRGEDSMGMANPVYDADEDNDSEDLNMRSTDRERVII